MEIFFLALFPLAAAATTLLFRTSFLVSTLLFLGWPSFWLSCRSIDRVARAGIFTVLVALPLGIMIDYIAIVSGSWLVPSSSFGWRLLGVIPVEDIIWGPLLVYFVVIFFEHFFVPKARGLIGKKMVFLLSGEFAALVVFIILLLFGHQSLVIRHAYLWLGSVLLLLPTVVFLTTHPRFMRTFFLTAGYFFYLSVLFEYSGLSLRQWVFPGSDYIGWIRFFKVSMPIEEAFFWFVTAAMGILSYYEFFDTEK